MYQAPLPFIDRIIPPVPECVRTLRPACTAACRRALETRTVAVADPHHDSRVRAARRADTLNAAVHGPRQARDEARYARLQG